MSEFNSEYNYHDSKIRKIIVSTLGELEKKLVIRQYTDNNEFTEIKIPFYYSLTGAQDFLIDNFMTSDYTNLSEDRQLEGNYEVVPRGVISLSSLSIDAGSLVNRNTRTEIPKKVDENTYKMYSYETMIIPVILSFDVKIASNSNIEMFKITESIIGTLYKSNPMYIDYGAYRVRGSLNVPEDISQDKNFEYSQADKELMEITFSIEVTTSIPIFDPKSEKFAGNVMEDFEINSFNFSISPSDEMESNQGTVSESTKEKNKLN